jgi:hypothetical protein
MSKNMEEKCERCTHEQYEPFLTFTKIVSFTINYYN